jgi:gluconokinase
MNRGCPDHRELAAVRFFPPIGWEIVQLVGLQTLNLAILVRVQVSQPTFLLPGLLAPAHEARMIVIVMGTTGSGKSTIGSLLANRLGWEFVDADDFHPPANVEKMKHGIPLTDADREPWLKALHDKIVQWSAQGRDVVLACSALRQSYRDELRASNDVKFVYLKGSYELFSQRVLSRKGHFAKQDLLASQFATLEEPADAITVDAGPPPEEIVAEVRRQLGAT